MPIIIDANCLANVFVVSSKNHAEFKPVLDWIINGKGMLVYGGTQYIEELKKTPKFIKIFNLLNQQKKVFRGDDKIIDEIADELLESVNDEDFDDPHLIAIVRETKCKIICSEDTRSLKFVKNPAYYPKGVDVPVYYTGSGNKDLLDDKYVDESLKPLIRIAKRNRDPIKVAITNLKK